VAFGIGLVLAVFGCVVLHELGHALAARRYGIQTKDITLLPIGGIARLERMPEDPKQELVVAIAGPAVNVAIAAALFGALYVVNRATAFWHLEESARGILIQAGITSFLVNLLSVNIWLVAFNMLPAFPMDGGRVLRALLAMRWPYVRATRTAAAIGRVMAVLFGVWGLFSGHFLLMVIALFIFIAGHAEAQMAEARATFRGVTVGQAMITRFWALSPDDSLSVAVEALLTGHQQDFPVLERGRLVGMLSRAALVRALSDGGLNVRVGSAMTENCTAISEAEPLDQAFQRIQRSECSTLPVLRDGQLVGLLTVENVGEWVMVQSALAEKSG
jgi:Zn-dependent protease